MANPIFVLDINEEGVVATHVGRAELPVLVAPTPEEELPDHKNTVRPQLIAVGCMNLADGGFEFDSSFVVPRSKSRFTAFGELMTALKKHDPQKADRFPPIAIFGHADPTGKDEYNKALSGRRARAVFGMLTRDVALWEKLFSQPLGHDDWGTKSIQNMLSTVGIIPFYTGPIDGGKTPETKQQTHDAIQEYQKARGIAPANGIAGPATRKVLFKEYMDEMCRLKGGGPPYQLDPKTDFLARGKDAGHKGDIMGCGEFNPILLLSQEEEDSFKDAEKDDDIKEARNVAYADDRRVLVYVFKHDSEIDPKKWPCPRATEGGAACVDRFWADHKERLRRDPVKRRKFKETEDTCACRFYHAFARYSPCEAGRRLWVLRLQRDSPRDVPQPLARVAYVVQAGDVSYAPLFRGFTDKNGQLVVPVIHEKAKMTLKVDIFGLEEPPDDEEGTEAKKDGDDAAANGGNGGGGAAGGGGGGGGAAAGGNGGGAAGGGAPAGTGAGADADNGVPVGVDIDRFEHEEDFLEMTLDAGVLEKMSTENFPARQRLYNLGYGSGPPAKWDDATQKRAVTAFQRSRKLNVSGSLDSDTRSKLKTEHEGGPPPG